MSVLQNKRKVFNVVLQLRLLSWSFGGVVSFYLTKWMYCPKCITKKQANSPTAIHFQSSVVPSMVPHQESDTLQKRKKLEQLSSVQILGWHQAYPHPQLQKMMICMEEIPPVTCKMNQNDISSLEIVFVNFKTNSTVDSFTHWVLHQASSTLSNE